MSFGGFGGFGQTNQSSGFGTGTGFGGTSSGGFGSSTQNQSNSLFGNQNRTSTGFGTPGTSSGSLFGSNTATAGGSGFGGFGSSGGTGFGSTGTGGGLFGNKPAGGFGTTPSTGGGFGSSGGFGGGTGFGGGAGTAFQQAVPPSDGTGSTPFSPHTEKDGAASNITNHYQSISFMQPYNKYSFEELRLGDYNQGRRFGNGSGQAGAFGTSAFGGTGFGQPATGFGASAAPFGSTTSAPSGFGQPQTSGGFGTTPSNPLFGASKPAAPSLFGTTAASTQPSLFGGTTSTAGGFGTTSGTGGFGGGGSLFGGNQQQSKPLFGSTGATGTTGGTGFGGFGQQATSAPNPFGTTTATSSPFGGQQQTGTGFGGFGQQNQAQAQAQTQNKGLFGGGGFGAGTQQQSTPSLFGGGTTGTSLFGQSQPQQQQQPSGGSLFGGATQPTGTTSLFGGGAQQQGQKSLFGGTTGAGTGTGGFSAFGNAQNQQAGTGGLFGGAQNQQQQKPSLFGGTTGTGSSLFGNQPSAPQTGLSLFGNTQAQQQQAGGLGTSSLFGSTQRPQPQPQQQLQQPAPGSFQASLLDANPYGHQSIFSGLPAPSAPSPGPLATPLSSSAKQKQSQRAPLPIHKMTPSAANRLITPPRRPGYGFSYSTYGTPLSSSGTPTGLGGSLLGGSMRGGSLGRGFSKSFSTSNLRNTFEPDTESVLSPGALSGQPRLSSSNVKRLTIDRSLRNDLFTRSPSAPAAPITNGEDSTQQPDKVRKKVSFDASSANGVDGTPGGEVVHVESKSPEPTPEELGFLRSIRKDSGVNGVNGDTPSSDGTARPEMESVRGSDLAVTANSADRTPMIDGLARLPFTPGADPQPGEYWMRPTRAEINKMSREEQKHVVGFTVGRQHCGEVTFGEPVDLTTVNLDQVFGGLVDIALRRITVYPDESMKPPLGKGLNVPSTLRIENSWPRNRDRKSPTPLISGPLFEKHVDRLKKVVNTEFIGYEKSTGTWVFKVPHFTTYGLDYDSDEGESHDQNAVGSDPDTPKAHPHNLDQSVSSELTFLTDDSFVGSTAGVDDDTFDFKKRKIVPGSFGGQEMDAEEGGEEMGSTEEESFLEEGSTGSTTEQYNSTDSQRSAESEVGFDEDTQVNMAGSFPRPQHTVERDDTESIESGMEDTQTSVNPWGTPTKARLDLTGDWADQLQRTISPRKQDRNALREIQANAFSERTLQEDTVKQKSTTGARQKGFTTSIDLMNSLFQQPHRQQPQRQNVQTKSFEWPYNKQPKTFAGKPDELTQDDVSFHRSFKPRWGPMDTLICGKSDWREDPPNVNDVWEQGVSITSEGREIKLLRFNKAAESDAMLEVQVGQSTIDRVDGIPFAHLSKADFHQYTQLPTTADQPIEELLIWHVANILFNDDIEDDISAGVPPQLRPKFAHRIKKDRLSRLWERMIREEHANDLDNVSSPEESAVHLLCSHRIEEACKVLNQSRNLHLATLIAQIGRDRTVQSDMANQIEVWRRNSMYSEMTEPIRALYELLAGNTLRCEGKLGGALEDRASTFTFTDRFDLDWFQAFGLRLWYGITEDEPIEAAVSMFLEDLTNGNELAFPYPSHLDSDRGVLHTARDMTGRESPLWVLLKLYSATVGGRSADIPAQEFPASLLPQSVSGDQLTNRLSFQLHQLLGAAVGQHDCFKVNVAQADQLTWDYAWELSSSGRFHLALFVLLHLSRPADRERAVKETLARFAPMLPIPLNPDGTPNAEWSYFAKTLHIPETWLWVAKALDARSRGDATSEVDYLIKGKHWNDAHTTLCQIVGPTAVIERDYNTLENLISEFGDAPERRVRGWISGGGVYQDFLHFATAKGGKRDHHRLDRLVNALIAMEDTVSKGSGVEGLEERVAFKEMSRTVANWAAREGANTVDASTVLGLPLTGDARVIQTVEMSRRYYSAIMAGAY